REPGGFEGLLLRPVLAAPCDLPVADRVEVGVAQRQLPLRAGALRTSAAPHDRDDLVLSRVDQLHRLQLGVVQQVEPLLQVGPQGVLAVDRATVIDCTLGSPVVDVVRPEAAHGVKASLGEGFEGPAHQLHVLLRHRPRSISLLPQPGGFEGFVLVHEALDADQASIAKSIENCGFGVDLHATTPPASEFVLKDDHLVACVDELLGTQLRLPVLIPQLERLPDRLDATCDAPVRKTAASAMELDLGADEIYHLVRVPVLEGFVDLTHDLDVLPRHRLLRKPGGFEGFGSLLEHPKASDLPVLDRVHARASRGHLDPFAPPKAGGERDHNFGPRLSEALRLDAGLLKRRVELVPEGLALATAAIDTLHRTSGTRPVNF